jgi:hypothetical protein
MQTTMWRYTGSLYIHIVTHTPPFPHLEQVYNYLQSLCDVNGLVLFFGFGFVCFFSIIVHKVELK